MNVPNKFVKILSEEDYIKLIENHQKSENFRVRNRAHAILLSCSKYPIDEIAVICGVHRNTLCRWIERWHEFGLKGLRDGEKEGRPPISNSKTLAFLMIFNQFDVILFRQYFDKFIWHIHIAIILQYFCLPA